MTETSFMHTTQFEYDGPKDDNNRVSGKSPVIINGGEYELFNVRYANAARTSYFLLGGKAWIHRFAPGAHPNTGNKPTNELCVVNAIGGEYPEFYLSGIFRPELGTNSTQAPPHCYTNGGLMAFVAHGNTVDFEAEPATGYHFTAWQEGNLVDGYTDIATDLQLTYTTPNASTAGIKAVFDTNTYALNVEVANVQDDRGSVSGSNSAAKHFLSYEISATPNTGYHFVKWNDGNTANPRTVTLISDDDSILGKY